MKNNYSSNTTEKWFCSFIINSKNKIYNIKYLTTLLEAFLNLYLSKARRLTQQWHKSAVLTLNSSDFLSLGFTQMKVVMNHTSRDGICLPEEATSPYVSDHCLLSADMCEINTPSL